MFGYVSHKMDIIVTWFRSKTRFGQKLYSKKKTQLASDVRIIARREDGGGFEISICSVWPVSCSATRRRRRHRPLLRFAESGWQIRQHNVRLASGLDNYTPTVQYAAASAYLLTAVVGLT